ncbi:MAG: hypothetical protein ABII00_09885, partial [Elusimicrobiota bacterium]
AARAAGGAESRAPSAKGGILSAAARGLTAVTRVLGSVARAVAERIGVVYTIRTLHLHYPHRDWANVVRDMYKDDKVKATTGEHPVGALRRILDMTGRRGDNPAGLSVSFTPALMEIARKLFGKDWNGRWREAIAWRTARGLARMEMLLTGFHFLYGLLPWGEAAEAIIRWNVEYHETLNKREWGEAYAPKMKVFRPPEVGFSPEMVPGLVKAGVQVVVVDAHHVSRALQGYDAGGMPALVQPNKAGQRNRSPYKMNHFTSGKDNRNSKDVLPYAYIPHWLRYVDPKDGKEYKIIVFPMAGGPSYISGYQEFPTDIVQQIAKFAAEGRPLVMGLDTDGDNAWGGGYSSYMEALPRLAHWLSSNGHHFGTIQEYLERYPVPEDDVIDWVEPGAWPNADWGSPHLPQWAWPPIKPGHDGKRSAFDPDSFNFKLQFHALLTMSVHHLLRAMAAVKENDPAWELDMRKVVDADNDSSGSGPLEKALQAVLRAFDSGHVYYGKEPDLLHIPLKAAKLAMDMADRIAGKGKSFIPPTVWGPWRFPWNPGGENQGVEYGWRSQTYPADFDVYGFVYSATDLKRVELKWRASSDGRTFPSRADLLYENRGDKAVGEWNSSPMDLKDRLPNVEWLGLPESDRVATFPKFAHAHVDAAPGSLVAYYIETEDSQGRIQRTPISHVYVESPSAKK